ncbi:hypothetical protein FF38_06509 [Lucilia cuprina]|uniref:Uncharacterized protein n=1 Tax=Lucilia cuprina TaxID=7375 RepID=A0A0L0C5D4_LUCCU|nr:hypothetical protein FF38_06509 [Lucilia cuprina]
MSTNTTPAILLSKNYFPSSNTILRISRGHQSLSWIPEPVEYLLLIRLTVCCFLSSRSLQPKDETDYQPNFCRSAHSTEPFDLGLLSQTKHHQICILLSYINNSIPWVRRYPSYVQYPFQQISQNIMNNIKNDNKKQTHSVSLFPTCRTST